MRKHGIPRILPFILLVIIIPTLFGCDKPIQQPNQERLNPPDLADNIRVGVPGEVDLDTAQLKNLLDAMAAESHRDLNSVLVARSQRLVVEAYFNGEGRETLHDIRSAGKSITSTLAGMALHQGALKGIDESILGFFSEYLPLESPDPMKEKITVRHLLKMRSGFYANDDDPESPGNENRMLRTKDWIRYALNVPMSDNPGKVWRYAGMNTMLLGDVVRRATGIPLHEYLETRLLQPLGIEKYRWKKSPKGRAVGQGFLFLRPRDMLKFGLLFLQEGKWNDQQLLPASWVHDATRIHTPLNYRLYTGYGYQWWTARETMASNPVDFYLASGNGGQKIYVIPDADMVVVITSSAYNKGRGHMRSRRILRSVLSSILDRQKQSSN